MHAAMRDAPALFKAAHGFAVSFTAGTGADNAENHGLWTDRRGFSSLKAVIIFTASLAQGETLSIAATLKEADEMVFSQSADYGVAYPRTVVATGPVGGAPLQHGLIEMDFDLSGAGRYIFPAVTADLSAATGDHVVLATTLILAGATDNPVTATAI